jgi:hypothetical protein
METLYPIHVSVHSLAGAVSLLTFWLAAFARKGGPLHRGSGKVYLVAMLGICVTALPMAATFFLRGQNGIATFLVYLVVITGTSMWLGWRAIRRKRDQAAYRDRRYAVVGALNVLSAAVVLSVGLKIGNPLLIGFSAVGALVGAGMLRRLRSPIDAGNWWLQEHYGAMLGCGTATHVAFFAIGLKGVLAALGLQMTGNLQLVPWAVPVLVSFIAGVLLDRRYARKPATKPAARVATGALPQG